MHLRSEQLDVEINDQTLALQVTDRRSSAAWSTPGGAFELLVYNIAEQHYRSYTSAVAASDHPRAKDMGTRCIIRTKRVSDTEATANVNYVGITLSFDVRVQVKGAELIVSIPENGWN